MKTPLFDSRAEAKVLEGIVARGNERKYYRIPRAGRWYGGIATADCCGCNLKCVFCWSNKPRDNPELTGEFYSPEQVFNKLTSCAAKHNYRLVRISGNEPTIAKRHLLKVLSRIDKTNFFFILETNGTLLEEEFVMDLSKYRNLHIRVSLKGTNSEEFSTLTSSVPDTFEHIIESIKLLLVYKVRFNIAVMLSFSPDKNINLLKERLCAISPTLIEDFEEEYIFLYPHVIKRLKKAGLKPLVAYTPNGVPKQLM